MERMRHGYSHDTRGDGVTVVKRYVGPDAERRRWTERAALVALAGVLPVPPVLSDPGGDLVTAHVTGVHGQELIEQGHADQVLWSCGVMLRRLQGLDPPEAGEVLVHGDYGPNNMLFDPETFEVTAVLDWEWAHAGDPLDDLAWCEWIVRMHHPGELGALDRLFEGYGRRPEWERRQQMWIERCRELLVLVNGGIWEERLEISAGWRE
jgi:aminoglycoside phosphotransferase (APT) family kinase protein